MPTQVFALDMRFLDPRRPRRNKLTAEEQEERLTPYQDTLPFSPLHFASLNHEASDTHLHACYDSYCSLC
jgi:hypothetical protein